MSLQHDKNYCTAALAAATQEQLSRSIARLVGLHTLSSSSYCSLKGAQLSEFRIGKATYLLDYYCVERGSIFYIHRDPVACNNQFAEQRGFD